MGLVRGGKSIQTRHVKEILKLAEDFQTVTFREIEEPRISESRIKTNPGVVNRAPFEGETPSHVIDYNPHRSRMFCGRVGLLSLMPFKATKPQSQEHGSLS